MLRLYLYPQENKLLLVQKLGEDAYTLSNYPDESVVLMANKKQYNGDFSTLKPFKDPLVRLGEYATREELNEAHPEYII